MYSKQVAPRAGVKDFRLPNARTFLAALRPGDARWWGRASEWVYRGQSNAEWHLAAKAVRTPDAFVEYDLPGGVTDWSMRADVHNAMLDRFRNGLDRAGMAIPAAAPRLLSHEFNTVHSMHWPELEAFPLMALAQHHGLPTLLLDWSRRSFIAAYFAAIEVAEQLKTTLSHGNGGIEATHLAVWAIEHEGFEERRNGVPIFYQAPASTNPNLRAQAGVFTLEHDHEGAFGLEAWLVQLKKHGVGAVPTLRRLSMPVEHAPELVRLLAEEGIDGCSLFPGADGVVKAMRERALRSAR